MTPLLPLQWREWRQDDVTEVNYVISSWVRSYSEAPEFKGIARAVFFDIYEPVVKRLLARSTVAIAWTPDLPDTVLGYLVIEGDNVVHYVHTKRRFRRTGIARWMTKDIVSMPATFTHSPTPIAARLCGPTWKHDPTRRPFEGTAL